MTSLLVSVTTVLEAEMAISAGADIIDLKDPAKGALGALPFETINQIVNVVDGRKRTSATIGDVPMDGVLIASAINALSVLKLDYIKVGFFEADDYSACIACLTDLASKGVRLIAVLFSEKSYPSDLIGQLNEAGVIGIMLDTSIKNGETIFQGMSDPSIHHIIKSTKDKQMLLGLAGSLNITHITAIKKLKPDYVGFRGGVCHENDRKHGLDLAKVKEISKLL